MYARIGKALAAVLVVAGVAGTAAMAAGGGPKTRKGQSAQVVVKGVAIPTAFAFGAGQVFFSDGTPPEEAPGIGGVYVIKHGAPVKLAGSPPLSFGVVWHKGTLYVSAVNQILAWSGWNGVAFTKHKAIYTSGSKKFTGFNGLGFGADGRLYAGVDVGGDHAPPTGPFQYDVVSMTAKGKDVKVVARGIRQPWQLAFPRGSSSPYVSDLGQDKGAAAKNALDFVLRVKSGQNYGFPKCAWTTTHRCRGVAKPFRSFTPHTDAMGVGILGRRLFVSEFGAATPARVVSTPLKGGRARVELSFPKGRNIVGLGVHKGWVYVAEIAASPKTLGAIYRFKP